MAKVVFKNLEELKGIVQMIQRTDMDHIPVSLSSEALKIQMFNSPRTVYFSIDFKKELFHYIECSKEINFFIPSQFFCDYVLKVCLVSSSLIIEIKQDTIQFTTFKKGAQINSTIPLKLDSNPLELQKPRTKGDARITMASTDLVKSIKLVGSLEQPQISFKVHKNAKFEIVGSGNSIYKDSIQFFGDDGVMASTNITEMFNTSTLLDFICVTPPLDYITIIFNKTIPTHFQYHNALLDIVIVISKISE